MIVKILFNTVYIDEPTINPCYLPNLGLIINKSNNEVLYKFNLIELTRYFYFTLEFDGYEYKDFYQPKNNSYKKQVYQRKYNLNLNININSITNDKGLNTILYPKLSYYFTIMQIKELVDKKKYNMNVDLFQDFLNFRNKNPLYIIKWYYYRINDYYVYDLNDKRILSFKQINKINFRRKGAIIQSNNVTKIVDQIQKNKNIMKIINKTLIIIPGNMSNLWDNYNYNIITFEKLIKLNKNNFHNIDRKYKQIIIHECHFNLLIVIKNLVSKLILCNKVWIINSMPLKYYLSNKNKNNKINVNQIASLMNMWMDFNNNQKKLNKIEIIRFSLNKFNQHYANIIFPDDKIESVIMTLNNMEKDIYEYFYGHYYNWKNKLNNDPSNKYSFVTKNKDIMVESKIYNSILTTIFSVIDNNNISLFFSKKINKYLSKITNLGNDLDEILNFYYNAKKKYNQKINSIADNNTISKYNNLDYFIDNIDDDLNNENNETIDFKNILESLDKRKNKINQKIKNHQRYLDNKVYNILDNESCCICYSFDNLTKVKFICGHCICLECSLNTLANSNKCPLCNEHINTNKLVIVKESIDNYYSDLNNFIYNFSTNNLLLTNIDMVTNIMKLYGKNNNVININKCNISNKVNKNPRINEIYILTTPFELMNKNMYNDLINIVGYFNALDIKPTIKKIIITI